MTRCFSGHTQAFAKVSCFPTHSTVMFLHYSPTPTPNRKCPSPLQRAMQLEQLEQPCAGGPGVRVPGGSISYSQ